MKGHEVWQLPIAIAHQVEGFAVFVDRLNVAENERSFRVLAEGFHRAGDRAWVIEVIRIEPADDLTRGFGKPLVNTVCLPLVLFGNPAREFRRVLLDDLDTVIGRTAIDDPVFNVGIILFQDRANCLLKKGSLVEGGGDNGDEWLSGHVLIIDQVP